MTNTATDDVEAKRKLVSNERIKLSATYANGLALAIFAVGGFAPLISTVLSDKPHYAPVLFLMGVCWIMSGGIHWAARDALGTLQP